MVGVRVAPHEPEKLLDVKVHMLFSPPTVSHDNATNAVPIGFSFHYFLVSQRDDLELK